MSSNVKDDVDRLFECFKCGVTPPQSAMRQKKRRNSGLSQETGTENGALCLFTQSTKDRLYSPQDVHERLDKLGSTSKTDKPNSKKQFSPVVFYGSPHGVPPKRPIHLLRLLHAIRIDLAEQNKSNLRKDIWETFPRQDEAMKFAKRHSHARVFSYQDHLKGQRRYLVSTYQEFWQRYNVMDPKLRHHYEVIQEKFNDVIDYISQGLPCHLYFDLEFNKRDNKDRNGDEMVDLLVSVIEEALLDKYGIQGNQDWIVELDSTTDDKFSRHLVIRIPGTAFKDNLHAGAFIAEICSRICNARERDTRFENMFVIKDSNPADVSNQLFVDSAVYSRNRCFRLPFSSKAGKTSVLLPTPRFMCKDMCEENIFMASLICNIDNDCEKLLVCKMDLECAKTLQFDTEINHPVRNHQNATLNLSATRSDVPTAYLMGKSPFPALDSFIESIASLGNVTGKTRCWYWFSEYGMMVYSMSRSRYCERIGREHKSNHVIYVVDVRRGDYYQKCHDPDCRGYRSPLRPVPDEALPDSIYVHSSDMEGHDGQSRSNDRDSGLVTNDLGNDLLQSEKCITDSCMKDSWWIEAIKVAESIENTQKTLDLSNLDNDDEDESWWMAVESSLSEAEQMYLK